MATTKEKYTYATGKRRTSSARVRLHKGEGVNIINDMPFDQYFSTPTSHLQFLQPFKLTGTTKKLHITVRVAGGGKESQLEAVIHGTSKALVLLDSENYKSPLRQAGLLTRDPRVKERRKVGTGGKARRQKQSPKR